MIIIDAHLDLSWNAVNWNRDLDLSISEIRRVEAGIQEKGRGTNTVSLPELRRAEVAVSFATVLARAQPEGKVAMLDFRSQEIAYSIAQGQLAYYHLLEQQGKCRILRDLPALRRTLGRWKDGDPSEPLGFIISMEGADPIVSPAQVPEWWERGLRVVGLAHYGPSAYAHGTASTGELKPAGRDLLRAMHEVGMILDLTHLSLESFWEAIRLFPGPVLASHNNCRKLVPGGRQFDDEQIHAIIERGGVIGTAFDAWMLLPGWAPEARAQVTLENAVDHMDHICQIAGNVRHVAIGSDLDGGYGTEQCPADLDTIADLQKIPASLRKRGYAEADIEAVMHGNWTRFLETAWSQSSC